MNIAVRQTNRIDYIDAIKGFSILWVVIYHFGEIVPQWLASPYRMPLFFFLSGIFFRNKKFKEFICKRTNTLLIPLLFWMLISWLFIVIKYELIAPITSISVIPPKTTWAMLLGIKELVNTQCDLNVIFMGNGALWFLLALFNIQIIYYGINKLTSKRYIIIGICVILYVAGLVLDKFHYNGLFLISSAFTYVIYYALGATLGPVLMELIKSKRNRIIAISVTIPVIILLSLMNVEGGFGFNTISVNIRTVCFIPLAFIIFQKIGPLKILAPLRFFGKNSLVVLATHTLIFSIMATLSITIFSIFPSINELQSSQLYYFVLFFVVCVVDYFCIKFCNRYIPWSVGKKPLI